MQKSVAERVASIVGQVDWDAVMRWYNDYHNQRQPPLCWGSEAKDAAERVLTDAASDMNLMAVYPWTKVGFPLMVAVRGNGLPLTLLLGMYKYSEPVK